MIEYHLDDFVIDSIGAMCRSYKNPAHVCNYRWRAIDQDQMADFTASLKLCGHFQGDQCAERVCDKNKFRLALKRPMDDVELDIDYAIDGSLSTGFD